MKKIYVVKNDDEYDTTYIGFSNEKDAKKYQKDLKFYSSDSDYQTLEEVEIFDNEYKFSENLVPVVSCTYFNKTNSIQIRTKNVKYYNVDRLKANGNVIIDNSFLDSDRVDFLFPRNGNESYNTFLKRAKKEAMKLLKEKKE